MPKPNPFLLVTMVFWGYNFVSLKVLNEVMTPAAVMFWRFFIMWGILAAICRANKISLIPPKSHRNRIHLAGFFSMGIYMILFMEGVKRTGAAEAAIILGTNPIMVVVMSMAARMEPKSAAKIIGGIVSLIGVGIVVLGRPAATSSVPESSHLVGDLLTFASAFAWAYSVILAKPISKHIEPLPLFTMSMLGGLPVVAIYGLWPSLGAPALVVSWSDFELRHWLNFAQVTLGSGVIAMVFYYKGVATLAPSTAVMHQFLAPVLATGFAAFFLNERLAWIQGLGLVILLVGLIYAFKPRPKPAESPAEAPNETEVSIQSDDLALAKGSPPR